MHEVGRAAVGPMMVHQIKPGTEMIAGSRQHHGADTGTRGG